MARDQSDPLSTIGNLLAAARAGDDQARGKLLERYRPYLYAIALEGVDSALRVKRDASDLVQDSMLDAHRGFSDFQGVAEEELRHWLRRIMANNMVDAVRHFRAVAKRRGKEAPLVESNEDSDLVRDEPSSSDPSPIEHAIHVEEHLAVEAALLRIPADYCQVLKLRNHEQRSFQEIAVIMKRSPDAARKLWLRAVERLQEELKGFMANG